MDINGALYIRNKIILLLVLVCSWDVLTIRKSRALSPLSLMFKQQMETLLRSGYMLNHIVISFQDIKQNSSNVFT